MSVGIQTHYWNYRGLCSLSTVMTPNDENEGGAGTRLEWGLRQLLDHIVNFASTFVLFTSYYSHTFYS